MEFAHHARALADKPTEIESWRTALEASWPKVGSGFPNAKAFVRFAASFSSHEKWLAFSLSIGAAEEMNCFLQAVDASFHTTKEWIAAFGLIDDWLQQKGREATAEKRIGYLVCCSDSISGSYPCPGLSDVTAEMLALHGLE